MVGQLRNLVDLILIQSIQDYGAIVVKWLIILHKTVYLVIILIVHLVEIHSEDNCLWKRNFIRYLY